MVKQMALKGDSNNESICSFTHSKKVHFKFAIIIFLNPLSRFLPQTAILSQVDMVITHGGNNTVTEAFYFGKPMLVLPLFGDQYDNGQRIEETGLGLRLNPFHCSDEELLNAVDSLVSDEALATRMTQIGERIRKSEDKKVVSDLIENIFK